MKEVYEFIEKNKPYVLVTVDEEQPHGRPFGTLAIFEDKLYFQTSKEKAVAQQLKKNGKIELISVAEKSWLRLTAEAVLDERLEPQQYMLDTHPNLKGRYQAGDGKNEVYYLKNATAYFYEFGKDAKIINF